jgi:cytochrome c oxidase accessory protein FixG
MTTVIDNRSSARGNTPPDERVAAVNRAADRSLYATRSKIYPKEAHGRFRRIKWIVMLVALAIYYGVPWLRIDRGADLPHQAVLLDMEHNRFFFFFLEIWPQEFYYVTGLLVLGALALFLVTALAGRVWCGYACPQTVWTDLMIAIERFWQGDRNARMRLDKAPWSASKVFKKVMTHASWLVVGLLTGGAMVFYFRDAPTLARELVTGTAPTVAYVFLGVFTLTTYLLGGIAREQVCIYMCPWPRIQGAMVDRYTLLISYHTERGEPRGAHKKGQSWEGRGDCIDCTACVAVCPMGIDIRDGSQLECIQCALCIDACDDIMDKVGRPRGLIAYDTISRRESAGREHEPFQPIRARTMLYAGLFSLVGLVMLVTWWNRTVLEINVLHDRNPPFVRLSDGGVRNGYTVKILNKLHEPRSFHLSVRGLDGASLSVVGASGDGSAIRVGTDDLRELRVLVTLPASAVSRLGQASAPLALVVQDAQSANEVLRSTNFQMSASNRP